MDTMVGGAASEPVDCKRGTASIETILDWAYNRELIRVERGAVASAIERDRQIVRSCGQDPLERMRETGLLVDVSPNAFGVIPDLTDDRPPHPDALLVAAEVSALDAVAVDDWTGVDLLGEAALLDLTERERRRAHEDGIALALDADGRLARGRLSTVVVSGAVLGRMRSVPASAGRFSRRFVARNGRPAWFREVERTEGEGRPTLVLEMDGFDHAARRPYPGAYRKQELVDAETDEAIELRAIVAERIEWQVWRLALDLLADALDGRLARLDVTRSTAPRWPWEGEEWPAEARILPVLEKKQNALSLRRLTCDGSLA